MELSSQDPSLMAMDLSKGYSVNPLTRSHADAMDLAKKPEWYHRRPPGCSTDIGSSYRSRPSSSYSSLRPQAGAPVHCRDFEQSPETLGNYMNSTLAPGLDLYHDGVHSNLWHPGFFGPDRTCGVDPESSGGEESDSGSDVIVLVSSAKEPILCSSFIQDDVRHIVEPLSPAVSSLDEGTGCYHLPQPLSSPSPDSSYSEDSSDSSADIPVHHTRPVVLLSDLSAVYGNPAELPVDISSDDSDVIEVSVTNEKKKSHSFACKSSVIRETPPQSESEKAPPREVRRSSRIRKSVPEMPQFTCNASRRNLRRQVKNDAVGIYNESFDSDDMMEYAARSSSSDEYISQPNLSHRVSSRSDRSDVDAQANRKSPSKPQRGESPKQKPPCTQSVDHTRKKPLTIRKTKRSQRSKKKQKHRISQEKLKKAPDSKKSVTRRRRKRHQQTGPSALFSSREPEIKLKYANMKRGKKKTENFRPFVHMERRVCTVVNYQEEEAMVRSSRRRPTPTASALSGFVPNTSCFQLGRLSSESKCPATLSCCLCGQMANVTGLGDLHGPYYPAGPCPDHHSQQQNCGIAQEDQLGPTNSINSSGDGRENGHPAVNSDSHLHERVPPDLDECWIHEDCGIWTAGIFLIRGKLYGLEEAARLAQEMICSTCQQTGAIMGCFQKGCRRNYHYRCAVQSGCVLNDDNFSMRCPEHKSKLFISVTRQHKR